MSAKGSDGSRAPDVREVSMGRLKPAEHQAVRGTTTDARVTNMHRVAQSRNN